MSVFAFIFGIVTACAFFPSYIHLFIAKALLNHQSHANCTHSHRTLCSLNASAKCKCVTTGNTFVRVHIKCSAHPHNQMTNVFKN